MPTHYCFFIKYINDTLPVFAKDTAYDDTLYMYWNREVPAFYFGIIVPALFIVAALFSIPSMPRNILFYAIHFCVFLVMLLIFMKLSFDKHIVERELHDRVKNNLQIVSSMCSLESRTLFDSRDSAAFEHICERIAAMGMVHEKIYMAKNKSRINMSNFFDTINESGATAGYPHVYAHGRIVLPLEKAVSCALLVSELCIASQQTAELKKQSHDTPHSVRAAAQSAGIFVEYAQQKKDRRIHVSVRISDTAAHYHVTAADIAQLKNVCPLVCQLITIFAHQLNADLTICKDKSIPLQAVFER